MTMTKAERTELRSIVRQQFKVLRGEVEQRRTELAAEAAAQVRRRYADNDKRVDELNDLITQVVEQANKDIRKAIGDARMQEDSGQWTWSGYIQAPRVAHRQEDRYALDRALKTGLDAQVSQALLTLQRQEADLLRQLALGALESDEARRFLNEIPTVSQLVPASRLKELEAAFDDEHGGGAE